MRIQFEKILLFQHRPPDALRREPRGKSLAGVVPLQPEETGAGEDEIVPGSRDNRILLEVIRRIPGLENRSVHPFRDSLLHWQLDSERPPHHQGG